MQDSGVFHQKPLPQQPGPTMVKVTDDQPPLLCDDILSCILALDEVIAEFDDSHSLTNGNGGLEPPGLPGSAAVAASLITSSTLSSSSSSPPSSVPLASTPRTKNRHNSHSVTTTVNQETSSTQPQQVERQYHNHHHYPFSSLTPSQPQVFSSTNYGGGGGAVKSQEPSTAPIPLKTSQQTAHKLEIMSFTDNSEPLLPSSYRENNNKRVSLNQMEKDILAIGARKKRNGSKIPTLKSPTSPITIETNSHSSSNGGGGGGSFPKVKLRSSNNPLLEYRSVKMQHFIFPDQVVEPDEVIEEENWNFPTGKNLPRSLARTRETCGAANEDNAMSKASNPRFNESVKGDVKVSRIPKLKLETTCPIYEDNLPQLSPQVKSPGSISLDSPTSSGSGGRYNSNIPVAKPRGNSANNPPVVVGRNDSFSAIRVTSTPKRSDPSSPPVIDELRSSGSNGSRDVYYTNGHNGIYGDTPNDNSYRDQHNHHHHASDADDGYLSMINKRDDTTVLWPEELIENEVFSEDELKRLSYQSAAGSGGFMDDNHEIFAVNDSYNEIGADKTDYFSDDSLESEPIEPESALTNGMENVKKTPNSISFFANVDYIRPIETPKPRSSSKSSGIPKPCTFFVPMDGNGSSSSEPTMDSRGSKKRGKVSPPTPASRSTPSPITAVAAIQKNIGADHSDSPIPPARSSHASSAAHEMSPNDPTPSPPEHTPTPPPSPPSSKTTADEQQSKFIVASSAEPSAKFLIDKIQDFAQTLAYEIGRSGSEEAAVTLKQQLKFENQQENCPITCENHKEVTKMSDGHKTPPESMTPTRTTVAEFLASNVPEETALQLSRHEERLSFFNSPEKPTTLIDLDLTSSTEPEDTQAGKSDKISKEMEEVDRIITDMSKENPIVLDRPGQSEPRQIVQQKRPKSLDVSAIVGAWKEGKSSADDDNASDDLSETPPAFIPEPPPTVVELKPSAFQPSELEGEKVASKDDEDKVVPSPSALQTAEQPKLAPTQSISHTRGSSDVVRQSGTNERKNSRSSEDIVQAVNRDPAPMIGKTRSGASTLPLNTRPPTDGKGSFRPLRSMISRFKKNKQKQSHLSLSDETTLDHPEYSSGHHRDMNGETDTLERSNRHGSTKQRRNSASSSGSKKTSLFARIFLRRNK